MDWPSVFAGAGAAATLLGTAMLPYLRLRGERRASLRAEAAEERARRIKAEEELDVLRDERNEAEENARNLTNEVVRYHHETSWLRAENQRLRQTGAILAVLARPVADPASEVTRVFDASRDIWCIFTPAGEVLAAMGAWHRIGLTQAEQLGAGWRRFVVPRSLHDSDLAIARALAGGGKVGLWHKGTSPDGRPGEYCLRWSYGRYNGETLAVAQVISYRPLR